MKYFHFIFMIDITQMEQKNSIIIQETEEEIQLDNVEDLWEYSISINPDIFNEKKG